MPGEVGSRATAGLPGRGGSEAAGEVTTAPQPRVGRGGPTPTGEQALWDLLRSHRRRAGLTQQEVADRVGISVGGVRDLEQGRVAVPRAQTLRRLGVVLGLPAAEVERLGRRGVARERGGAETWIGVLGRLAVWVDGRPVDPGSESQRVLLGLLALSANVPIPQDRLLARLWAADEPASGSADHAGLAARVSRLRRRLQAQTSTGGPVLRANNGGYELVIHEDQLDLLRFRSAVARARQCRSAGDLPQAWRHYREAVVLWRGDPLSGLAVLANDPAVVTLVRQWPTVAGEFASVGVELGQPAEVVPVLRQVTAAEPLHEPAHAQLMVALAASGRQAEALRLFESLRRRLAHHLDTAPSPQLREAHRQVLRQGAARAQTVARAYQTLPPDSRDFAGREAELSWLGARVTAVSEPSPPVVVAIEAGAGAGKTRLALRFAHQQLADGRFGQQQLYADLGAFRDAGPVAPAAVLASFLHTLGVAEQDQPADVAGRSALYRDRLRGMRSLVVLDDAASAAQLAPLLPAHPESLTVVTSRRALGMVGVDRLSLGALTHRAALELLVAVLGAERVVAEWEAARRLVEATGRLPLALSLLAQRLLARPACSLREVAARLADPASRLAELVAGDRSMRAELGRQYRALPREIQQHLRLLAGQPHTRWTAATAAVVLGTSATTARRTLEHLCREHLVFSVERDRYGLGDLVRDYLREAA